jgi:mRNA interferase MazF
MAKLVDTSRLGKSSPNEPYCPDVNEIIKIDFDPQMGREQAERRPAIVLSPRSYNKIARLCVLCPITNQIKGYPFEVKLPDGFAVTGVALSDQIKSFSWPDRNAEFVCVAPDDFVASVRGMIKALIKL